MFNLIIFDLDGTLVDTIEDIHECLNTTISKFGFPTISLELTKSYVGDGMKKLVERAVGEENFDSKIEEQFRSYYAENIVNRTKLYDGVTDIMNYLSGKNIAAAVISNKSFALTDKIVKHFKLNKYLFSWHGGDSFGEKKPSPVPVLKVLEKYGTTSDNALMVGDNHTDILSGSRAGLKTCFCEYGYGKTGKSKPDFRISKFRDILTIITENIK